MAPLYNANLTERSQHFYKRHNLFIILDFRHKDRMGEKKVKSRSRRIPLLLRRITAGTP